MSNADLVHEQRITIHDQRLTIHKQRVRIAELEYLLARYEETEIEEDVLEKLAVPSWVVVIERMPGFEVFRAGTREEAERLAASLFGSVAVELKDPPIKKGDADAT